MPTAPAPLEAGAPDSLDDFRVTSPREIAVMLRELCDTSAALQLQGEGGSVYNTIIWAIDEQRGSVALRADPNDAAVPGLLRSAEVVVVGHLRNVKIQFSVANLVLTHGRDTSVLSVRMPREFFRFQRRHAFRVRPYMRGSPNARLVHAAVGGAPLDLRLFDISIGGCAVFVPDAFASIQPGLMFEQVEIDLDADTRFRVDMRVQHVTPINAEARGVRLGCEFVRASGDALRALQRFIDQAQKRRHLIAPD